MSRSGYIYGDEYGTACLYRQAVDRAITGKRGQEFLMGLARELDAMPVKQLIKDDLIDGEKCCTLGVVCKSRGVDVNNMPWGDSFYMNRELAKFLGIARSLVSEIEYENDEAGDYSETPSQRWRRMRRWVNDNLLPENR